ncbi:hypothetical protein KRR23_00095 [Pseudomonas sp. CVAP|uniref:hypothetical protein n=1 Tax=Pseudomonas sp. CVAP\|nr:hypothetical protein [Pseudomonas sp. CVAP\
MTYSNYFKGALWVPAIILPALLVVDAVYFSPLPNAGMEQLFQIYVLGFGLAAYVIFAFWASRVIDKKSERDVVRLAWWAPVIFIPFYGAPWILYGLLYLLSGSVSGLGLMVMWLAYTPYILVVGYFFSIVVIAFYKAIIK